MPKLDEFIVHRVFALMTDQEGEGSGVKNKLLGRQNLVLFAGMASRNGGKICFWSNDVNRPVVGGNYLARVRKQQNPKGNERGI